MKYRCSASSDDRDATGTPPQSISCSWAAQQTTHFFGVVLVGSAGLRPQLSPVFSGSSVSESNSAGDAACQGVLLDAWMGSIESCAWTAQHSRGQESEV